MERKKRIAFFQEDLQAGGIQKSLFNLLRNLDYDRADAELFLFEEGCFFEGSLPEKLKVHVLPKPPRVFSFLPFPMARRLWKVDWSEYGPFDVSVDFNSYQFSCAAGALGVQAEKRIMWIHNDVEIKRNSEWKYRVLWHFFRAKLGEYDAFAAVSPGIVEGFRRESGITDRPITVIPNQIDTAEILRKAKEPVSFSVNPDCYNLGTMGRICHQKGFDILIDLFAQVFAARPDMRLYLLGDGPDREKLERQIARLGLSDAITLLGSKKNPFCYLDKMDGFALTSRYEGQGMVIWEAKTLGLELFLSKNLETYNPGVAGYEDVAQALIGAQKQSKTYDDLSDYHSAAAKQLEALLGLDD